MQRLAFPRFREVIMDGLRGAPSVARVSITATDDAAGTATLLVEIDAPDQASERRNVIEVGLGNVWALYLQGAPLNALIATLRDNLAVVAATMGGPPPFAQVRASLLPKIEPLELLERQGQKALPDAPMQWRVYDEIGAGLGVGYVIDLPTMMIGVNGDHLDAWGIDRDELRTLATTNARRLISAWEATGQPGERLTLGADLAIWALADGRRWYAATLLIFPEILERWSGVPRERMAVAAPARDVVFVARRNQRAIMTLAAVAQSASARQPWPLTKIVMRYDAEHAGGQVRLCPLAAVTERPAPPDRGRAN